MTASRRRHRPLLQRRPARAGGRGVPRRGRAAGDRRGRRRLHGRRDARRARRSSRRDGRPRPPPGGERRRRRRAHRRPAGDLGAVRAPARRRRPRDPRRASRAPPTCWTPTRTPPPASATTRSSAPTRSCAPCRTGWTRTGVAFTNEYAITALLRRSVLERYGGWRDPLARRPRLRGLEPVDGPRAGRAAASCTWTAHCYRRRMHAPGLDVKQRAPPRRALPRAARHPPAALRPAARAPPPHRPLARRASCCTRSLYGERRLINRVRFLKPLLDRAGVWTLPTAAVARAGTCRTSSRCRPNSTAAEHARRRRARRGSRPAASAAAQQRDRRRARRRPAPARRTPGPARTRACAGSPNQIVSTVISTDELSATPAAPSAPQSGIATRLHAMFWITTTPAMRTRMPGRRRGRSAASPRTSAGRTARPSQPSSASGSRRARELVAVQRSRRSGPRSTPRSRPTGISSAASSLSPSM